MRLRVPKRELTVHNWNANKHGDNWMLEGVQIEKTKFWEIWKNKTTGKQWHRERKKVQKKIDPTGKVMIWDLKSIIIKTDGKVSETWWVETGVPEKKQD